jgi:hypothetical protein
MFVVAMAVLLLKLLLLRENRRRDRLTPEQFAKESGGTELADRHPAYRYYS